MKSTSLVFLLFFSTFCFSQQIKEEKNCTVQSISNYTQFGNGDVLIFVKRLSDSKVVGYWLENDDVGFERAYETVLDSYKRGTKISIGYFYDPTFTGVISVDQGNDSDNLIWDGSMTTGFYRIAVVNSHK